MLIMGGPLSLADPSICHSVSAAVMNAISAVVGDLLLEGVALGRWRMGGPPSRTTLILHRQIERETDSRKTEIDTTSRDRALDIMPPEVG